MKKIFFVTLCFCCAIIFNYALATNQQNSAITKPIPIEQLTDFAAYPDNIKALITEAAKLSQMNLTYQYGSAQPTNKGMDCSGTIYYLLNENKLADVPRDAEGMFNWLKKAGVLQQVSGNDFNAAEFAKLKPGDLLFWSGTYATTHSISHVMLYLGKNKAGQRLMFGASDGRTYQGKKMWGVSVFDFQLPKPGGKQKFVGYGCIPELTCSTAK